LAAAHFVGAADRRRVEAGYAERPTRTEGHSMTVRTLALAAALFATVGCSSGRKSTRSGAKPAPSSTDSSSAGGGADKPKPDAEETNKPDGESASAPRGKLECHAKYRKGTLDVPRSELEGTASFYAKQYHGKQTASGELFDMNAMSAAHRTLLLGTKVRVTNMDNGRQVEVCINDRGPYAKDRILDLSYAAAKELGIIAEGEGTVKIEVLDKK